MYTSGNKQYLRFINKRNFNRDAGGAMSGYEAIAVIEYQGTLSRAGVSQGHYICDIKNNDTKQWFRTNDNRNPVRIDTSEVSKNAYAVLFKRM